VTGEMSTVKSGCRVWLFSAIIYMNTQSTCLSCLYRSAVDQQNYEEICSRLMNAKQHVIDSKDWFVALKANKPRVVRVLLMLI